MLDTDKTGDQIWISTEAIRNSEYMKTQLELVLAWIYSLIIWGRPLLNGTLSYEQFSFKITIVVHEIWSKLGVIHMESIKSRAVLWNPPMTHLQRDTRQSIPENSRSRFIYEGSQTLGAHDSYQQRPKPPGARSGVTRNISSSELTPSVFFSEDFVANNVLYLLT